MTDFKYMVMLTIKIFPQDGCYNFQGHHVFKQDKNTSITVFKYAYSIGWSVSRNVWGAFDG